MSLTDDQLRLLHSYADGPRIWDAASILPAVLELESMGLLRYCGWGAQELTKAGRKALDERSAG